MRKFFGLFVFIALASSCAQVLSPDGGAIDKTPPKILSYSPDSAATNFTSKKIVIHFNEFVALKDLQNQLIVSPPLNHDPDVTIRKKDIVIEISDTLLPNTTYTISFGNAIVDIAEGNILENFRYIFSTGPVIDSLHVAGKITNAATLLGEKGILVMLYNTKEDSVPLKKRPYYFTKTKEDGSFIINNIKAGQFKIFALDDKNSNYLFDNSDERIAFSDSLVTVSKNLDSLKLKLFKEEPRKQFRLKASQPGVGRFTFIYALPLKNPQVSFHPDLFSNVELFKELSVTGDTLDFWFNALSADSLTFFIKDEATHVNDTIAMQLIKPAEKSRTGRGGASDARKLQFKPNVQAGQVFDLGKNLMFMSNNPIKSINEKNFILLRGRDTLKTAFRLSENKRLLTSNYVFLEDSSYSLFIKPGAVTDCFGQNNDTIKSSFKIQSLNNYGTLKVKLTGIPSGNYLLQLVDGKDAIVREIKINSVSSAQFDLLSPGTYRLKLIADENKNGKWDTGNYLQHKQPEKIIYYAQQVKMRSGWDMDVEWVFK
ncbi:MAG: Ig-like domain-containing protein [Bacteroidetes bacterium]|nr:Ig-like domain-containing protein [Bacteroidota bacterium]